MMTNTKLQEVRGAFTTLINAIDDAADSSEVSEKGAEALDDLMKKVEALVDEYADKFEKEERES
jgi:hypothetical protein